jgi:PAS domain S-box-containing protein
MKSWPTEFEKELAERKKSESKFKGLLESAPDAMVITDGNGKIQMVNAQAEKIFGYNRTEMINEDIELLIPQRYRSKHVHHRREYVENPKVRAMGAGMVLFGRRKDGSEFPVEVSLSPLSLDDGEFMVMSAIRDTTKQKEIEAEIKKINENLEILVKERTKELEDALSNEKAIRAEMLRDQNYLKLLTEISEVFASSLDISKTLTLIASRLVPTVADWCTIDQIGNDETFHCLAAFHADPGKTQILYKLRKKYPPRQSYPKGIYAVFKTQKPLLVPDITDEDLAAFAENEEHFSLLQSVGLKSAMVVPLLSRSTVFGLLTFATNTNERKHDEKAFEFARELARRAILAVENAKLYKELQDVNQELEQRVAKRTLELEAINKELEAFSYSVSHDLRAPLRSIDGFSNKILKDYGSQFDESAKDYFARIMNASRKMGTLIDDLLKLARLSRVEMKIEQVNLSDMASAVVSELKETNPERRLEFEVQENMVELADRNLIRIALENMLGNAWKYSKNNPLTIIKFASVQKDEKTVYYISDNGVGFDMRYADKLFGAFQRLHNVSDFEGTGIGLATVQRIIRRHHGNIWADSEINKGTTFFFTLNE